MYGDDPKFRARLQTISVKHTLAICRALGSALNPKFSGQMRPAPILATIEDT
jgi:hypothetical protein